MSQIEAYFQGEDKIKEPVASVTNLTEFVGSMRRDPLILCRYWQLDDESRPNRLVLFRTNAALVVLDDARNN